MSDFVATEYKIISLCCGAEFEDKDWVLECPNRTTEHPALIRAVY